MEKIKMRNHMSCYCGAAALLLAAGAALGGTQIADATEERFPQPDPLDWTNQLTIGDIDGDDDLDIVFANGGNFASPGQPEKLRIYVNDGAGFFTDETEARGDGVEGNFRGVEMGDVERDGDLDLIASNDFDQRPVLLINDGAGFFNQEPSRLPGERLSAARAQFGDIDNDGDLDIYILDGGPSRFGCGQNKIYVNDGDGFFTDETDTRHPVAVLCEPQDAIFGDVDGDFDLDVRTGSTDFNQSRLYINDGAGFFTTQFTPADNNTYSYDFGDIDNDGDLDLLGANSNAQQGNAELLLINDGSGTYTNGSSQLNYNPSVDDNDSKFFDYDYDGDLDLIIARLGGAERVLENDGTGEFDLASGVIQSIGDSSLDIKVGDLTGDGALDVVTGQGESGSFKNRIYVNTGPTDTLAPRIYTEQAPTQDGTALIVIRASIRDDMTSDRGPFLDSVVLEYGLDGQFDNQAAMDWSGHRVYRGVIAPPPCGGTLSYRVVATDQAGNVGQGDPLTVEVADAGLPADLTGNGVVDSEDLNMVLADFGCSAECSGDVDGDGDSDSADLNLLLGSFGQSCG